MTLAHHPVKVKLTIEESNEKLLWAPLVEVKKEDDRHVRFSDGSSFKLEEGKSIHGRPVFEGARDFKEVSNTRNCWLTL